MKTPFRRLAENQKRYISYIPKAADHILISTDGHSTDLEAWVTCQDCCEYICPFCNAQRKHQNHDISTFSQESIGILKALGVLKRCSFGCSVSEDATQPEPNVVISCGTKIKSLTELSELLREDLKNARESSCQELNSSDLSQVRTNVKTKEMIDGLKGIKLDNDISEFIKFLLPYAEKPAPSDIPYEDVDQLGEMQRKLKKMRGKITFRLAPQSHSGEGKIFVNEDLTNKLKVSGSLRSLTVLPAKRGSISKRQADAIGALLNIDSCIKDINLQCIDMSESSNVSSMYSALKSNTSIKEAYMYGCRIGPRGGEAMAEILKVNSTLRIVNLYKNRLDDDGAAAILEGLKVNTSLDTLYLTSNGIGDEGCRDVRQFLKVNTTLDILYLGLNEIGWRGAMILAESVKENRTLDTLNVYNNQIGDKGGMAMIEALKINDALPTLNLKANNFSDAMMEVLKDMRAAKGPDFELDL